MEQNDKPQLRIDISDGRDIKKNKRKSVRHIDSMNDETGISGLTRVIYHNDDQDAGVQWYRWQVMKYSKYIDKRSYKVGL